jgi:L,D-transpeptidase YbiS
MQIRVHIPSQTLDLLDASGTLLRRYPVSTSKFGIGSEEGSFKTPTGRFQIAEKHGAGAPEGEIFVGRIATGRVGIEGEEGDHVQTRILWLDGLDPENANTKSRYIYLHGTNWERLLGTPASHGCVRLANTDIIDLFNQVPVGTPVTIEA